MKRRKKRKRRVIPQDESDSSDTPGSILKSSTSSSDESACSIDIVENKPAEDSDQYKCTDFTSAVESETIEKLCPCTDMSVGDIVFSILSLGMRHKLSWDAQVDILKLFNVTFKTDKIPTTKYSYLKKFNVDEVQVTHQIFCHFCQKYLGEKAKLKVPECSNCKIPIDVNSIKNSFITMSVASQLESFLKDEKFVQNILHYRFQNAKDSSNYYHDIYDGAIYKKWSKDGNLLSNPLNFSYTFFTDGMAFGNTSVKTMWPIYLTINELPYEERSKYLILAALYIGAKDPNLQTFLQPFVTQANELSDVGVKWTHNSETVISKVIPLCCVADSVARCKMMNYQSFSAQYGCTFCYKESENVPGHGQRFIFKPDLPTPPLRSDESLARDLREVLARRDMARDEDRVYRGVKGYSPLSSLRYFSMSRGFVVDYMHCILLGVAKAHMELLLENPRKRMWERMVEDRIGKEHLIATIDERISRIQSSTSVIRELRPISSMAKWRASEQRLWLLFYWLPCLKGLLKDKYLSHLGLLSKATYLLLQRPVSEETLKHAHSLLLTYTLYYQKNFGEGNMTYNIHLLSHVAQGVLNFGPVFGHNSFVYEAQNRYLREMCKSPSSVLLQVARKFLIYRKLPLLCSEVVQSQDAILFADDILHYKRLKTCFQPFVGCTLLGTGTLCSVSNAEQNAVLALSNQAGDGRCFQRMILRGRLYCTAKYCVKFKNNDSCALTTAGNVVLIKHIMRYNSNVVVIIAERLQALRKNCVTNKYASLDHVKYVKSTGIIECLSVDNISRPCIVMSTCDDGLMYSAIPYACSVE